MNAHLSFDAIEATLPVFKRALKLYQELNVDCDSLSLHMDLALCHQTTPLDLEGLLRADDANFAHDIGGIVRHLDRETGLMKDCFVPRFTKKETTCTR